MIEAIHGVLQQQQGPAPPAGISFVGSGGFDVDVDPSQTFTLSMPSSLQTDDFCLAFISLSDDSDITAHADWTLLAAIKGSAGPDTGHYVFWLRVDGTETSTYDFDSSPEDWAGVILAYRGVDTGSVIDTSANGIRAVWNTSTSKQIVEWTGTLATGYSNGDWLISSVSANRNTDLTTTTLTFPSGVDTERVEEIVDMGGTWGWCLMAVGETEISGTPSPGVWTHAGDDLDYAGMVLPIILKAA